MVSALLSPTLSEGSLRRHGAFRLRTVPGLPPTHEQHGNCCDGQEVHDRHVQIEEIPREQPLIEIVERPADWAARRRIADPAVQVMEGDKECFPRGHHERVLEKVSLQDDAFAVACKRERNPQRHRYRAAPSEKSEVT